LKIAELKEYRGLRKEFAVLDSQFLGKMYGENSFLGRLERAANTRSFDSPSLALGLRSG